MSFSRHLEMKAGEQRASLWQGVAYRQGHLAVCCRNKTTAGKITTAQTPLGVRAQTLLKRPVSDHTQPPCMSTFHADVNWEKPSKPDAFIYVKLGSTGNKYPECSAYIRADKKTCEATVEARLQVRPLNDSVSVRTAQVMWQSQFHNHER